jgi:hypothetical protein
MKKQKGDLLDFFFNYNRILSTIVMILLSFNSDGFPKGPLISAYHGFADFLLMDTRITAPIYWRISLTHLIILLLQSQDYNPLLMNAQGKIVFGK